MSEELSEHFNSQSSVASTKKRSYHRALWISSTVFLSCAIGYLIYWLIWAQFRESTNDTYVNGNMIQLTPQERGIVTTIWVDNTQIVEAGQPVVELDRHDFEIELARAEADLAETVRRVSQMFIKVDELKAKRAISEANLLRAELDYEHRKALVDDASVSREDFEHSETTLLAAEAELKEVSQELAAAWAEVENTNIKNHPLVEQRKASLRRAFLGLHRCTVRAPARGIITLRKAQVGQWVEASSPLMALVPLDQIWVDANFREVSLKHLRIGQPVELHADMYGRGIKFHGRVVGLNPGTGSVFSVLPPQNATGNWIKIVQRIPVKISLSERDLETHPLILGLSMTATIDTHDRTGLRLPQQPQVKPAYTTEVYANELCGVDTLIEKIIANNTAMIALELDERGVTQTKERPFWREREVPPCLY